MLESAVQVQPELGSTENCGSSDAVSAARRKLLKRQKEVRMPRGRRVNIHVKAPRPEAKSCGDNAAQPRAAVRRSMRGSEASWSTLTSDDGDSDGELLLGGRRAMLQSHIESNSPSSLSLASSVTSPPHMPIKRYGSSRTSWSTVASTDEQLRERDVEKSHQGDQGHSGDNPQHFPCKSCMKVRTVQQSLASCNAAPDTCRRRRRRGPRVSVVVRRGKAVVKKVKKAAPVPSSHSTKECKSSRNDSSDSSALLQLLQDLDIDATDGTITTATTAATVIPSNVKFHEVEIREYPLITSFNHVLHSGPAVSLSWDYKVLTHIPRAIDQYERYKEERRKERTSLSSGGSYRKRYEASKSSMRLTDKHRINLLKSKGFTDAEIRRAIIATNRARTKRQRTLTNLKNGREATYGIDDQGEEGRSALNKWFFFWKEEKEESEKDKLWNGDG